MPRRRTRVVKLPPAESLGNLFVCRDQLDTEAYILGFVDGAGIDCYFIKARRTHERRAFTGLEISTSPILTSPKMPGFGPLPLRERGTPVDSL